VRSTYLDTDQKLNHILENDGPALLSNVDYEAIDHLEHAIHNMSLLEKCALTYLLAIITEKKITKIPLPIREMMVSKLREDQKKFSEMS